MIRSFHVHYGNGHVVDWQCLFKNFRSLQTARKAARARSLTSYDHVVIVSTDGGKWVVRGGYDPVAIERERQIEARRP